MACALLLGTGPRAFGQEAPAPIAVVDPSAVPFSSGELTQALLARMFPDGEAGPPRVQVTPAGDGTVNVQVGNRSRRVELAERTGPAAARIVAIVILELMSDGGADTSADAEAAEGAAAAPESPAVTVAQAARSPAPASVAATATPEASSPAVLSLYLTGGAAKGLGAGELLAGTVDLDLAIPIGERLRIAPSVGFVYMPPRTPGAWNNVSFASGVGRVLAGTSWGLLDFFGGPFVASYKINGDTQHDGTLFGVEALARVAVPVWGSARLVAATRAHAYANRVRVSYTDGATYATPRLELTLGVGVAWDWLQ
jgi:hypothetical protein